MRTRSNKKRQHGADGREQARGGKRRGDPARDPIPRVQNRIRPSRAGRANTRRNSSEAPQHPPFSLFGWALWRGFSFVSLSPPAPSAPLERTRLSPRTITPFADALHAQLTFVAARPAPWAAGTPRTPTISRDAGASRMYAPRYAPPGDSQPLSPVSGCMRRAYVRPAGARHPHTRSPLPFSYRAGASREHSTQARQNPQRHSPQRPHQRRLAAHGNRATAPARSRPNKQAPPIASAHAAQGRK